MLTVLPSLSLIAALPSLLLFPAVSNAGGVTNVTCNDTSINWAFNAKSFTPCEIAANLSAVCASDGVFTVGPLVPVFDNGYLPPDSPSKCTCNTVTYAMISACSLCQGGVVTNWQYWYSNCSNLGTNGSFPFTIPPETDVPRWAYLDVLSKNAFDPVEAKAIGDLPEVKSGSAPFALPVNASTPSGKKKKSNAGAIAGGVVGGIVALLAVLGLALFLIRRRKTNVEGGNTEKNYATNSLPQSPIAGQYQYQNPQEPEKNYVTTPYQSPMLSPQGAGYSSNSRPYDPNDPSTFPVSPMSHHSKSLTGNVSYPDSEHTVVPPPNVPHQQGYGQQPRQSYAGGYSGVAEI